MAGFGRFIAAFATEKSGKVGDSLMAAIVAFDPQTAGEADLRVAEEKLDELSKEVARAKTNYDREKAEADNAERKFANYAKVAQDLKKELDAKPGDPDLTADLQSCLDELTTYKPERDREVQEAQEAKTWLDELTDILKQKGAAIRTRRAELESAQRQMAQAERRAEVAQERADQAAKLAGLRTDTDRTATALDAMRKKINDANEEAEAARLKASVITGPEAKNDRVAARLAAVTNPAEAPKGSIDEQMRALGIAA